jgi:hypothetical protein
MGDQRTVRKAICFEDIIEYEEYNENGLDVVQVLANGDTFLVDMSWTAFHEMMTQEAERSKMNL